MDFVSFRLIWMIPVAILFVLLMILIGISILVWVYKDAKKRDMEAGIWLIIVLMFHLLGIIIYLIVRSPLPEKTPVAAYNQNQGYNYVQEQSPQYYREIPKQQVLRACPVCNTQLDRNAIFCPSCGNRL